MSQPEKLFLLPLDRLARAGFVFAALALAAPACGGSNTPDAPTQAQTLYERLGGHAGIERAVDAIVTAELADPDIAPFFAATGRAGHPTGAQIAECFVVQIGQLTGGPEVYGGHVAAGGFTCRDMRLAHATLHIPDPAFTKFVTIAAGVLERSGVAPDDIKAIGAALEKTRGDIVNP